MTTIPSFAPGARVSIDGNSAKSCTVMGWPGDLTRAYPVERDKGYVPLCADHGSIRDPDHFAPIDRWVGAGRGRLILSKRLKELDPPHFERIPDGIGVCIPPGSTIFNEVTDGPHAGELVTLYGGLTGRVLQSHLSAQPGLGYEGEYKYEIAWHPNLLSRFEIHRDKNPIFHSRAVTSTTVSDHVTWELAENVVWCTRHATLGDHIELWPKTNETGTPATFAEGDYALFGGARPVSVGADNGCRYSLMPGDLIHITNLDTRNRRAHVALPPWSGERYLSGCAFMVNISHLRPLKHRLIQSGTEVEVIANIDFGGESLAGAKGVIVIPTDTDGDVGVEFNEPIRGAGSLDGRGETGRCLYIPASAVKAEGDSE